MLLLQVVGQPTLETLGRSVTKMTTSVGLSVYQYLAKDMLSGVTIRHKTLRHFEGCNGVSTPLPIWNFSNEQGEIDWRLGHTAPSQLFNLSVRKNDWAMVLRCSAIYANEYPIFVLCRGWWTMDETFEHSGTFSSILVVSDEMNFMLPITLFTDTKRIIPRQDTQTIDKPDSGQRSRSGSRFARRCEQ
jgi:hypothetical protein